MDAAARAIARAREKAKAKADMTPAQKLDASIDSLVTRVEKASAKLEQARAEESDHVDALTPEWNRADARREKQALGEDRASNEESST